MIRRLAPAVIPALALVLAHAAAAAPHVRLGFDDDTLKWMTRPNGVVSVERTLGAQFTRITIPWREGEVRPRRVVRTYLRRAVRAAALRQKVVLAVYNRSWQAPTDPVSQEEYCSYTRHLLRHFPNVAAIVIWNEANSPRYWPQDAGAPAYEALLARCWDALHAVKANVNVIDSTASRHDPARFIAALGDAYRASGRTRPIVDTFGHNPYPDNASEVPWAHHAPGGTIGEGDYQTLLDAITRAFRFTAQRVPSAEWTRLWYLEDGFQTSVPWIYQPWYTGRENDHAVLASDGDGLSQSEQLRSAISLAYCQPAVGAFFNFELIDESRLGGWQSGLMYANGARKPSFEAYREIASQVADGTIDCSTVTGAPPLQPSGTSAP